MRGKGRFRKGKKKKRIEKLGKAAATKERDIRKFGHG